MKLSPEHIKLYKAIDEIIWNEWDPIDMKYIGGPREEYESYVPAGAGIIAVLKIASNHCD